MFKKTIFLIMTLTALSACTSAQNAGNSLADKGARYAMKRNIGQNYKEVASQKDFSLEREPVVGHLRGKETLKNGNKVYYHEKKQQSPSTSTFGSLSFGDKHVRYDYYAFLVSPKGIILDFAHKRSNSTISHFGIGSGIVRTEIEGDEEKNTDLKEISEFITSKDKHISVWKK